MTRPASEPGESEFSHGRGLQPPERTGATRHNASPEEWGPTVYEQGKAIQRTDPADPDAVADPTAKPGTPGNQTGQQWIRER